MCLICYLQELPYKLKTKPWSIQKKQLKLSWINYISQEEHKWDIMANYLLESILGVQKPILSLLSPMEKLLKLIKSMELVLLRPGELFLIKRSSAMLLII